MLFRSGRARGAAKPVSPPVLSPDQSAALRDRLLGEIATLPSEDSATDWAQRALAAKNQLTAAERAAICFLYPIDSTCGLREYYYGKNFGPNALFQQKNKEGKSASAATALLPRRLGGSIKIWERE